MTDRTCNGWKHHATLLVSLWLDEDGFDESMVPDSRYDAAQTIKDWYELADKYIEMRNNEEEDSEVQD